MPVVDNARDRRILGYLTEAYTQRRCNRELEARRREELESRRRKSNTALALKFFQALRRPKKPGVSWGRKRRSVRR